MNDETGSTSRSLSVPRGQSLALRSGNALVTRGLQDIAQFSNRARAEELVKLGGQCRMKMEYDDAIAKLRATGATVVMFTGFDARGSKVFSTMRGRTAIYNELVRGIAGDHGALLVDYWRFSEYYDWGMWAQDRMHMSAAGHANMAKRVLDVLEHDHSIDIPPMTPVPELSGVDALRANARWFREYAGPWVVRRVTGKSSGDGLTPKYPELIRL